MNVKEMEVSWELLLLLSTIFIYIYIYIFVSVQGQHCIDVCMSASTHNHGSVVDCRRSRGSHTVHYINIALQPTKTYSVMISCDVMDRVVRQRSNC